jgi:hypothetical protein
MIRKLLRPEGRSFQEPCGLPHGIVWTHGPRGRLTCDPNISRVARTQMLLRTQGSMCIASKHLVKEHWPGLSRGECLGSRRVY